jgi:hypothetical protein
MYVLHFISISGTKTNQLCTCDDAVNRKSINMPHVDYNMYVMSVSGTYIVVLHIMVPCVHNVSHNESTKNTVTLLYW